MGRLWAGVREQRQGYGRSPHNQRTITAQTSAQQARIASQRMARSAASLR